ncbi:MAG: putative beta-lysine N-acetyltransferase [Prosthecochloris sp.]|jgi:beta-lysine N6-acetyltransferase|nr:putative beta-lysine N-acetyltransferase [Prosthecochloris sp.]
MSKDIIEQMDGATLQHGPDNDRIYLMSIGQADPQQLAEQLKTLAEEKGYTKIVAKIPASAEKAFLGKGYEKEAAIPGFYNGREAALFMCFYPDPSRKLAKDADEIDSIITLARNMKDKPCPQLPTDMEIITCGPEHAREMSSIYKQVFPTYPFPIHDPGYIRETMQSHIRYFGILCNNRLVALASSEMDRENRNVEMTDFATLPGYRGQSLAILLLERMEQNMQNEGIRTAYTIARAASPGMNITFSRAGYAFSGTLVNNTNISGGIESMNVWYRPLSPSA